MSRCADCDYERGGLPEGAPCPECGSTRIYTGNLAPKERRIARWVLLVGGVACTVPLMLGLWGALYSLVFGSRDLDTLGWFFEFAVVLGPVLGAAASAPLWFYRKRFGRAIQPIFVYLAVSVFTFGLLPAAAYLILLVL